LVSVAGTATELSVTAAQYGAKSGNPLSYRIVSQTIDDERYFSACLAKPMTMLTSSNAWP
jgi:hypothetical protein